MPTDSAPRGVIASFPRSGLNWVRYCIEHFSGQRTPGRVLLVSEGAPIVERSHDLVGVAGDPAPRWPRLYDAQGAPNFARLVLILRNYKEGLASEGGGTLGGLRAYIDNVRAYDGFAGPKCLVYYEELMLDFGHMLRLLDFLQIDYALDGFDLDAQRARSQLIYHARRSAYTRNAPTDFTFHSRRLTAAQRAEADAHMRAQLGAALYARYVARYHEAALAAADERTKGPA